MVGVVVLVVGLCSGLIVMVLFGSGDICVWVWVLFGYVFVVSVLSSINRYIRWNWVCYLVRRCIFIGEFLEGGYSVLVLILLVWMWMICLMVVMKILLLLILLVFVDDWIVLIIVLVCLLVIIVLILILGRKLMMYLVL